MDIETQYQNALDYIYAYVDYSLTKNFRYAADTFNLERVRTLLDRLGNPHLKYPVIHVAGTKGKGSVTAMIASALAASGKKTGFYTSPHLWDFCERIQISGQPISHEEFVNLLEEMKPHIAAVPEITTFEISTALGFLYFARMGADFAVVEVGLGGRLDATNVVEPLVSVITSISYDHMSVLGNSLTQIATEKAGIIKPGRPVVIAPQKEEAHQVFTRIAAERGSRLVEVGKDILYAPANRSLDGQSLYVWSEADQEKMNEIIETGENLTWQPTCLEIPLLGYHQVENAATAYTALQVAGLECCRISEAQLQQGFRQVKWPARFELLRRNPPLIVDSAHNRDSALKLRLTLDDYFPGKPVILVFGASEDKDITGMFDELVPRVERIIATQSIHPRAIEPGTLVQMAHQRGCPAKMVMPVEQALQTALEMAGNDRIVLVAGSLFIAAAATAAWNQMPEPA